MNCSSRLVALFTYPSNIISLYLPEKVLLVSCKSAEVIRQVQLVRAMWTEILQISSILGEWFDFTISENSQTHILHF